MLIRVVGQAPLQATVYELQELRCHLCGKLFTAPEPDGVGSQKYDATTGSMIALLKYGSGLPFNRLQRWQENLGIPLPAATQWDIVHAKTKIIVPAHQELIRQAAQGDVLDNDGTNNKILEFMGKRAKMPCHATYQPNWRRSWPTAWFTVAATSLTWSITFLTSAATCWRP